MMPIELRITRFGSFIEEQVFTFPAHHGLFFMQGINLAEPALEANGTGKTTLWKALTWVLFGKDPRGLKAGDVANWTTPKNAKVELLFEADGKHYTVWRTHSPNAWKLRLPEDVIGPDGCGSVIDLAKDDPNLVYSFLKLDFDPWLNTVLMAQGEPMFLDLKGEAKATLFANVMGLDKWLGYSKRAGVLKNDEDAKLRTLERRESELRGQLDALGRSDVGRDADAWERSRQARRRDVTDLYERLMGERAGLEHAEGEAQARLTVAEDAVRQANFTHTAWLGEVDKARNKVAEDTRAMKSADAESDRLDKLIKSMTAMKECPTCGTAGVSLKGHVQKHRDDLQRAIANGQDLYGYVKAGERKLDEVLLKLETSTDVCTNADEQRNFATREVSDARRAYELNERELDRLEDKADAIDNEVNPHEQLQRRQADERADAHDRMAEVQASIEQTTERFEKLGFWVSAFKDIRLQLIGEALEQFAIEANSEIAGLGLADWELIFEIDRETKSGTISRGFTVYIRSPHNDKPVPWDAWSGGEAQRLKLGAQMGFSNLVRNTTGATIPLEVWDEPTTGLSAKGVAGLLETLSQRARAERRQIWVVDHRSLGFGGFDGSATVIKDKLGSHVEASYEV